MSTLRRLRTPAYATLLFVAVFGLLELITSPGDRLYAFIYERGFVQPAAIGVSCLIIVMLLQRLAAYREDRDRIERAKNGVGALPDDIAKCLQAVSSTRQIYGNAAALTHAERLAEDHKSSVRKSYAGINYLGGCLPALGLFGTMLGMSNALFTAFASGSVGPESVQAFVSSLATAMDTTVMSMACAAPLLAGMWLLERLENENGTRMAEFVREHFALDGFVHANETIDALRTELNQLGSAVAVEAGAAFKELLGQTAAEYRDSQSNVVEQIFDRQRRHDRETVDRLAERTATHMAEAVAVMVEQVELHNRDLVKEVTRQIGQLEQALHDRTPEEVIIRYRHDRGAEGNGHTRTNGFGGRLDLANGKKVAHD